MTLIEELRKVSNPIAEISGGGDSGGIDYFTDEVMENHDLLYSIIDKEVSTIYGSFAGEFHVYGSVVFEDDKLILKLFETSYTDSEVVETFEQVFDLNFNFLDIVFDVDDSESSVHYQVRIPFGKLPSNNNIHEITDYIKSLLEETYNYTVTAEIVSKNKPNTTTVKVVVVQTEYKTTEICTELTI